MRTSTLGFIGFDEPAKAKKKRQHKTTPRKVSIAKRSVKEASALISNLERSVKSGKADSKAVWSALKKVKTRVSTAKRCLGEIRD
jgi:hypothetical protein